MITEQEFLDALDVVKKYQIQISEMVSEIKIEPNFGKTSIPEWIKKQLDNRNGGSNHTRLLNGLIAYCSGCFSRDPIRYIEDMTLEEFKTIRTLGVKSWNLFLKSTGRG